MFQLPGVPWLRDYLAGLLREYLATIEVQIQRGAAGGLPSFPKPAEIAEAYREGGLAALVQSSEQRGDHAPPPGGDGRGGGLLGARDGRAWARDVLPGYETLREAMDRRRQSRSAPQRILERLLGLDLKMRQYVVGKQFCDAVVRVERHRRAEPRLGGGGATAHARRSWISPGTGSRASRQRPPPPDRLR